VVKVEMENRLLTRNYTVHAEISDRDGRHRLGLSPRESFFVSSGLKYLGTVNLGAQISVNGVEMEGRIGDGRPDAVSHSLFTE
jgi:hypothetical protein